jgi:hypothetical protein
MRHGDDPMPLIALTSRHERAAVELLSQAFFENPPHVWIFPDRDGRLDRMRWLLRRVYRGHLEGCDGVGVEVDGVLRAMAFLQPPGAPGFGVPAMLRHGLLAAPFAMGAGPTRRALGIQIEVERRRAAALSGRDAWTLFNVALETQTSPCASDHLDPDLAVPMRRLAFEEGKPSGSENREARAAKSAGLTRRSPSVAHVTHASEEAGRSDQAASSAAAPCSACGTTRGARRG